MRNAAVVLRATSLATLLSAAACGGYGNEEAGGGTGGTSPAGGSGGTTSGAGGGGGNAVTTLDVTLTLGALTTEEAGRLCSESYAYFQSAIPVASACKWKGLSFATSSSAPSEEQLRANCSEKEGQCLADPATALSNNPGCSPFPSGCGATVGEYTTCIVDQVAAFNQAVAGLSSCDMLTSAGTVAVTDALVAEAPASCTFSTCAGLFPPSPLY